MRLNLFKLLLTYSFRSHSSLKSDALHSHYSMPARKSTNTRLELTAGSFLALSMHKTYGSPAEISGNCALTYTYRHKYSSMRNHSCQRKTRHKLCLLRVQLPVRRGNQPPQRSFQNPKLNSLWASVLSHTKTMKFQETRF